MKDIQNFCEKPLADTFKLQLTQIHLKEDYP